MPRVTLFNYQFAPTWKITVLSLFAILFFIYLGTWQLERAKEKKAILFAHLNQNKIVNWTPERVLPNPYQQIAVEGTFLPENFLLDNQHHNHQIGFNVFTPIELSNKALILIDRGWIPAGQSRNQLPNPKRLKKSVYLTGQVYYPSSHWLLGQEVEKRLPHLILVERINTKLFEQIFQKTVYPFVIRLDKDAPDGYLRSWPLVSMPPERHQAYAFQWFAMALLTLLFYLFLNSKRLFA